MHSWKKKIHMSGILSSHSFTCYVLLDLIVSLSNEGRKGRRRGGGGDLVHAQTFTKFMRQLYFKLLSRMWSSRHKGLGFPEG